MRTRRSPSGASGPRQDLRDCTTPSSLRWPRSVNDEREIARTARAYQSPTQLSAGFGFYRTFDQDKAFNAAQRGPLSVPLLIVGGDRGMGELTAAMAEGMRAHGATDVRTATVTQSSHWVAQEQPSQVAGLIDRLAAGSR